MLDIEDCYDAGETLFIIYMSTQSNTPEDFNPLYALCFEYLSIVPHARSDMHTEV